MDVRLVKAMVIGDGSLDNSRVAQGYRNARFAITHSAKQKDYLLWKRDLLAAGGLQTWYSEFMNTTNPHTRKKALMCRIESSVSPILTVMHGLLYPKSEGFKPGVLDDLEDLHLAIIFMDDGGKQVNRTMGTTVNGKRYKYACEPYIGSFRLSLQSHGFSGAEQFRAWLKTRFSVESRVFKQLGKPVLAIVRNTDKERFRSIVRPFIHPCVAYKIDGTFIACRERLSERTPEDRVMRQSELAGNEPREGVPKSLPADLT